MRKISTCILLLVICSSSFSQVIEKNKRILGGSLGLSFYNTGADTLISSGNSVTSNSYYISLAPSFGKALKDNYVVGFRVMLGYSHSKNQNKTVNENSRSEGFASGIGVFIEKFYPLGNRFSFSATGGFDLSYSDYTNKTTRPSFITQGESKSYNAVFSIFPALNYSLNKKFLIQFSLNDFVSLGYHYSTAEMSGTNISSRDQSSSQFQFNSFLNNYQPLNSLAFSFRYIF